MSRIPARLLTHSIEIADLAGTSGRGGQKYAEADTIRAHVEEKTRMVVDRRTDSPTFGTEIPASAMILVQLEQHREPGARVTLPSGKTVEVIESARREYPGAPSHSEIWVA